MEIAVCIKQVPDPAHFSELRLDPVTKRINREGVPAVVNPADKHALEEALRIKEKFGGKVTVLTMAPPQAEDALRECLAMGADEAVLLCDNMFAGSDTLATARVLSAALKRIGFELVLCGNESADGATGQVPPQLAEFLSVPHVTNATELKFITPDCLHVRQRTEYGYMLIELRLPAVVSVRKELNVPRYPTVSGIMVAASREIPKLTCKALGLEPSETGLAGSPTKVAGLFSVVSRRRGEIFSGSAETIVEKAIQRLHELGGI